MNKILILGILIASSTSARPQVPRIQAAAPPVAVAEAKKAAKVIMKDPA
jgi:hypothetical protein